MVGSTQWTTCSYAKPRPLRGTAPHFGWTTQFNGVYQVCNHCMLTQSTQLGCSCTWALAFIQSHKLVQLMLTRKLHKHYDEDKELRPFEPCHEGWTLLVHPHVYILAQGARRKPVDFLPKSALRIWWFSHFWTVFRESCHFSSKWNHLWHQNASLALKMVKITSINYASNSHNLLIIATWGDGVKWK